MTQRKYTVAEIDALRQAVENKYLYGSYLPRSGMSRCYKETDKEKAVEERVRTHMLAGQTAADLYGSETPRDDARLKVKWPTKEQLGL